MNITSLKSLFITLAGLVATSLLITCSSQQVPTHADTPAPPITPTPALTTGSDIIPLTVDNQDAQTDATHTPTPTPYPYDSDAAMFRVFAGFDLTTGYLPSNSRILKALEDIKENNDTSMVLVLIESMRFQLSNDVINATGDTLQALTGQNFPALDWKAWSEWAGNNREKYPPPDDYIEWKMNYLRQIDNRLASFLSPVREGRSDIDITEIEWGGVIPDGIPDLQNPGHIPAQQAEYLDDDERVIGISINDEHRAYPLRIVNAHELVNDTLGGEQLALTW